MWFSVSEALLIGVATCLFLWYRRRKHILSHFERLGIPGPKPNLLTGNFDLFTEGVGLAQLALREKYGDIVGYFLGANPVVQVTDPELLKIILIQEYFIFNKRDEAVKNMSLPHPYFKDTIALKSDYRWKSYRATLTSILSACKMKLIMKVWNTSYERFFPQLKEEVLKHPGGVINLSHYLRLLTIDNFYKSSLSADRESSVDVNSLELKSFLRLAHGSFEETLLNLQGKFHYCEPEITILRPRYCHMMDPACFPELKPLLNWLRNVIEHARSLLPNVPSFFRIAEQYKKMVFYRQQNPEKFKMYDLFQALLDIRYKPQDPNNFKNKAAFPAADTDVRELTPQELQADLMFMNLAGFETTALSLGYTLHLLAHHPEVQERLRKEITSVVGDRNMDYDDLQQLPYLEQVINEALRIYPPTITFITRVSNQDYTYKNITFPSGTTFYVPLWALHHSPDLWRDPHKFDPERFSPEMRGNIDPLIYQPFGRGQRSCLAERYGLNQVRSMTCQFLQRFRLEPSPNSPEKIPEMKDTIIFVTAKNGIELKLVPLEN